MTQEAIFQKNPESFLFFCKHGKAMGACWDGPGMRTELNKMFHSKYYVRSERVTNEECRQRFDGLCADCEAERQQKRVTLFDQ